MGISKSFKMALSSIINNKVRALLTMLGIIIGISAVIILVSVMNGLTSEITKVFGEFGTTSLTTTVRDRSNKEITPDQLYEFTQSNPTLFKGVSPKITVSGEFKTPESGDDTVMVSASGVSEDFYEIQKLSLGFGRFISYMDCENKSNVAVIGSYQAVHFFGSSSKAIGQTVRLNGIPYSVIGVLEEKEDSSPSSGDNAMYIPYTAALAANRTSKVNSYVVNAASDEKVQAAKTALEAYLLKEIGDDEYYSVVSFQAIIDSMLEMMDKMEMVLVAIAGISLLVGGIGIMNIQLVSVSERTREIGIRKSLGAKHRHIMSQFVMESGVISCIGGIIGIIIGATFSRLIGNLLNMNVSPSVGAITIAFGVSVGIGVVFGFLPARKAARLNPIDALRNE